MAGEFKDQVNDLGRIDLPYGKEVRLEEIIYESGMRLLRMRLREGKRHTVIEVDAASAAAWGEILSDWAAAPQGTNSA
jgi:hypothetical protein